MYGIFRADGDALSAGSAFALNNEGFITLVNDGIMRTCFKTFTAGDAAIGINFIGIGRSFLAGGNQKQQ